MDPTNTIPVYFAYGMNIQLQGLSEVERWAVILRPDLKRKDGTLFNITVFEVTRTIVEKVPILLAFQETTEQPSQDRKFRGPAYEIDKKLRDRAEPVISIKDFPSFYTLIPNLEGYRKMVGSLGPEDARRILDALNDLVTVGRRAKLPDWYEAAVTSSGFNTTFLRDSETFFAFNNAAPILRGLVRGVSPCICANARMHGPLMLAG